MPKDAPVRRLIACPRGGPRLVKQDGLPARLAADPRTRVLVLTITNQGVVRRACDAAGASCGETRHADEREAMMDAAWCWPVDALEWREVPADVEDAVVYALAMRG